METTVPRLTISGSCRLIDEGLGTRLNGSSAMLHELQDEVAGVFAKTVQAMNEVLDEVGLVGSAHEATVPVSMSFSFTFVDATLELLLDVANATETSQIDAATSLHRVISTVMKYVTELLNNVIGDKARENEAKRRAACNALIDKVGEDIAEMLFERGVCLEDLEIMRDNDVITFELI